MVAPIALNQFISLGQQRALFVYDMLSRWVCANGFEVASRCLLSDLDVSGSLASNEALSDQDYESWCLKQIAHFSESLKEAHIKPISETCRISSYIPAVIAMIQKLVNAGWAVPYKGHVIYDMSRFSGGRRVDHFGDNQRLDQLLNSLSMNAKSLDFVLWRKPILGERGWQSPWGLGRPAWDISQCAALGFVDSSVDWLITLPDLEVKGMAQSIGAMPPISGKKNAAIIHARVIRVAEVLLDDYKSFYELIEGQLSAKRYDDRVESVAKQSDCPEEQGEHFIAASFWNRLLGLDVIKFALLSPDVAVPMKWSVCSLKKSMLALTRLYLAVQAKRYFKVGDHRVEPDLFYSYQKQIDQALLESLDFSKVFHCLLALAERIECCIRKESYQDAAVVAKTLELLGKRLGLFSEQSEQFFAKFAVIS